MARVRAEVQILENVKVFLFSTKYDLHWLKGVYIINWEYPPGVFFKGCQIFGHKNNGSQIFRRKFKGSQINFKV